DPTDGIHEVIVVLGLGLVGEGRWANLESGAGKDEFVDAIGHAIGGAVEPEVGGGYRSDVVERIVDVHEAKTEFVDESRGEKMCFGDIEEARFDRSVKRKVKRGGSDAAGQRAAQGFLQVAAAKR